MTPVFATTPAPPYWAVVFTSRRNGVDEAGYADAADRMLALARDQRGFLGAESARGADGLGITVSYWADEVAIAAWRDHAEHRETRRRGRAQWYDHFEVRIARVERAYSRRDDR